MAVQIINDMPDVAVHRGDPPAAPSLADWSPRASGRSNYRNRPAFIAITIGVHVLAIAGFLSIRHITRVDTPPPPIEASIIESSSQDEAPPVTPPPMTEVVYALPAPDQISIEVETITPPTVTTSTAIADPAPRVVAPPMVETVEYVRA